MGYQHTYARSHEAKLDTLSIYPTNSEIEEITSLAYLKAVQLAEAVGIELNGLPDSMPPNSLVLPGVDEGFTFELLPIVSDCKAFQQLVEIADHNGIPYETVSAHRDNLIYATATLYIN